MSPSAVSEPTVRMSWIDRQWAGHWSSELFFSLAAPPVEGVRDLLFRHFEDVPATALACTVDLDRGVWRQVPTSQRRAFVERMVVAAPEPDLDDLDAYQARHQAPVGCDQGARIVVSPTSLLVCFNHVVGDAMTFTSFATSVARLDAEALRQQEPRANLRTIARASATQGRSGLGSWARQVRSRRAAPLGVPVDAPVAGTRVVGPTTPCQMSTVVDREATKAMTAWGREAHPTATLSSMVTAAAYRALRAQALPVDPTGFNTLIDVRRWLPEKQRGLAGNLAKSLFVATGDLGDPSSVSAAQRALIDSGWPLPSLAVGALLAARGSHPAGGSGAVGDPITMSVIVMSSLPGLSDLSWSESGRTRFVGTGYPVGPDALSLFAVRTEGRLEVSMSFAREAIPDDSAHGFLELLRDVPALFGA